MNLDKFLQESTKKTFTIKEKKYIADISAKTMLRITNITNVNSEAERAEKMMELLFGTEISNELYEKLSIAGINEIITSVLKEVGILQESENLIK